MRRVLAHQEITVPLWLLGWLYAITAATYYVSVWAGIVAWLTWPAATLGIAYLREVRRDRRAEWRHPFPGRGW